MMRIYSYFLIAKNTFQESFTYRRNTIAGMLATFLTLWFRLIVWQVLYRENGTDELMGRTLPDMLTYTIITTIVAMFTGAGRVAELVEERMKSGEIALDLLRPTSARMMLVARTWGDKTLEIVSDIIPLAIGIVIAGGMLLPRSFSHSMLFLLSLFLGYLINLMFALVVACLAFYFVPVVTLNWFLMFFVVAMSGTLIPLWMLPGWLRAIALALPFQAANYVPASIYLGTMDISALPGTIGVQLLWIVGLWLLQFAMWRRGMRRITLHGG